MSGNSNQITETVLIFAGVFVGGGFGSVLRMLLGKLTTKSVPIGILIANTLASGFLAHVSTLNHDWVWATLSAGVAGGLSTFSTWAAQTGELWAAGHRGDAINNALLNLLLPVTAVLIVLIPQLFQGY